MRIELNCAVCGGNRFLLEAATSDSSPVDCAECGHEIGTLAQLKERVAEEVVARSSEKPRAA
jgi:uncharacterized Zn finger protein